MKKLLLAICLVLLFPVLTFADDVKIGWNPNTESDLGGYKVYFGEASGVYDSPNSPVDIGNPLPVLIEIEGEPIPQLKIVATLTGLLSGHTYYIVVTAYDITDNESNYSLEISGDVQDVTAPNVPEGLIILQVTITIPPTP